MSVGCDFSLVLPEELVTNILRYLTAEDLGHLASCSLLWRDLTNVDSLWRKLCEEKDWLHYGTDPELSMSPRSPRTEHQNQTRSKAKSSPSFPGNVLIDCQSSLNATCKWKEVFLKASHLERNWAQGHYHVIPAVPLKGFMGRITCIDWDGKIVVSGSCDGVVRVWDIISGQCLNYQRVCRCGGPDSVTCLQLKDNFVITGSSDSVINIIEIPSLVGKKSLEYHEKGIIQLRCEGKYLVTSAEDRTMCIWSWPECQCLHEFPVIELEVFYLKGDYVMSTSWDTTCKLWSLDSGLCVHTLTGHTEVVFCCQFDDLKAVTGGGDSLVKIWDLSTGDCTNTLEGHTGDVYCLEYSDDVIASGSADSTVRLWNHSGECLRVMAEHIGVVRCLRLINGKLVTGGDQKKIVVWDGKTGKLLNVVHRNPSLLHLMWVSSTKIVTASPESPGRITVLSYW